MPCKFDKTDLEILSILRAKGDTSKAEVARQVKLTPTAVFERIRNLEIAGVIRGYHARLDPRALGLNLLAYVFLSEAARPPWRGCWMSKPSLSLRALERQTRSSSVSVRSLCTLPVFKVEAGSSNRR